MAIDLSLLLFLILLNGSFAMAEIAGVSATPDDRVSHEDRQHYHTIGALAMLALGRVPRTGDVFERAGRRFGVIDMDGNRVDRVLVSPGGAGD
ncbi:MAG TPA: transporter associated domain-containing protein [Vicinamibacterales bacterium]|nr:transporter associated domain-containing protein [Vicinamibacterales bacterium]